MKFKEWFEKMAETNGIKNFSSEEFTRYFKKWRRETQNSEPPQELWDDVIDSLKIVQRLRDKFGRSITILSSYRSPAYNNAVGGAKFSRHKKFDALDITVSGIDPKVVYAQLKEWRDCGCFVGGLGLYVRSGFVHIDTRGENALMDIPAEMIYAAIAVLYAAQVASTRFSISKLEKAADICEQDRVRLNNKIDKYQKSYLTIRSEIDILRTPCLEKNCEREKFIRAATKKSFIQPVTPQD